MSTYTPTVEEARLVWQEWNGYGGLINRTGPEPTTRADMRAEFDRMIADVERAAAARALEELADDYDDIYANSDLLMQTAPKDYWCGADDAVKHATQKMRARAAEIREGN